MKVRVLALVAVATLTLAACGKSDNPSIEGSSNTTAKTTTTAAGAGGNAAATLPASVLAAKKLTVGSDVAYAPVEFFKEGTQEVQGIDFDLCNALAQELKLTNGCEFQNTTFDGIIPALTAKRFDIVMSSMSDTKDRQGKIDFVDYFTAGTSILVKKGNPQHIASLDDLCGKTIGLQKGTTQEGIATKQKDACKTSGKGDLTVLTFDKDTDALQQLKIGRTVADMNDFPVAAYTAQTSGGGNDFEVVGQQIEGGPYGIGVRKDDTGLRDALQAALKAIIASGAYDQVLAKWNVTAGALKTAAVNGGS